jgi:hypothetical protein
MAPDINFLYLSNLRIPAERLTDVSYCKEKPAARDHDEAAEPKTDGIS